jgi:tetratricopeptide (TPR) repeat protein
MIAPASAAREPDDPETDLAELLDELADRLQAGEGADVEQLARAHPKHAMELRRLAPAMRLLAELKAPAPANGLGPATVLGDFRILREVGRGGMGVVYEAEQVSLGRRVALKVLPAAATLDPRRLLRFQNEARAAACLHHAHIVPVFGVGAERGVQFYTMQLIDGRTLAAVIRDLRRPAEVAAALLPPSTAPRGALSTQGGVGQQEHVRAAARLGVQAAEALDYAHQLGVVHRDVKPGNLILDGRGQLWVTDFGLAQLRQGGVSLTFTGDVVGTLRYMSPEQALARRAVIDHRTDVYSLGVTLYELLTLRPPFDGTDPPELLRQITSDGPRSPRKWNKAIPTELETVVLKAMARRPAERYATAAELADDLRRFLEDQPVRARRPPLVSRLGRWCRRRRHLVTSVGLVLLTALLLGGLDLARRQQRRATLERGVGADLHAAELHLQAEHWAEARQAIERAAGRLAEGGPDALHARVASWRQDVAVVAAMEEARLRRSAAADTGLDYSGSDRAYVAAFAGYHLDLSGPRPEEAAERIRTSAVRRHLLAALDDWACVKDQLRPGSGEILRAVARQVDDDPWRQQLRDPRVRQDRAALERLAGREDVLAEPSATLEQLGMALQAVGAQPAARRLLREAQRHHPDDFWINFTLAFVLYTEPATRLEAVGFWRVALALRPRSAVVSNNLAVALRDQGQGAEAMHACRRAVALAPDLAAAHNTLGALLRDQGKVAEAAAAHRRALALKPEYALAYTNLGLALHDQGKLAEAVAAHRQALALRRDDADAYANLGIALHDQGRLAEAVTAYRRALAIKDNHARAWTSLGAALLDQGQLAEAVAAHRRALALRPDCADAFTNLGNALRDQGQLSEAVRACRQAIALKPDHALAHVSLGAALSAQGELAQAVAACRRALALKPDLAAAHNTLGATLGKQGELAEAVAACRRALALKPDHVEAYGNLCAILLLQGKPVEAEAAVRQALALKPDLAEAHCNLGHALRAQGCFAGARAALRRGHALGSRLPRWPYPSEQWVRDADRLVALDAALLKILRGEAEPVDTAERIALAQLCQLKKLYTAATRFYADAFAAQLGHAGDLDSPHRYQAACSAALAGCGRGADAPLDDTERRRLRRQARTWLWADLTEHARRVTQGWASAAATARQRLRHWQQDAAFAGVRSDALAKLPEDEQAAWRKLWAAVEAALGNALGPSVPEETARKKPAPPG